MSTDATSTATPDILWFSDRLRRDAARRRSASSAPQAGDVRHPRARRGVLPVRARARHLQGARRRRRRRRRRAPLARPRRARARDGAAFVRPGGTRGALRPRARRHADLPLHRGCRRARARPGDGRGALLAQGRHRAHGARGRRPPPDLVLLALRERPGPPPDGPPPRVPRRAHQHPQARARRDDRAPRPGAPHRRDGDRRRGLGRGAPAHARRSAPTSAPSAPSRRTRPASRPRSCTPRPASP